MIVLLADDERLALENLNKAVREAAPRAEVHAFRWYEDALEFAQKIPVDVAFLDVEMPGMSGVELARRLKLLHPEVNIIFVTGFGQYRDAAFALHASGYLIKPVTPEKVRAELADLRRPVKKGKRVRAQTFGNFEVFIDGEPAPFKYKRTKELLAYLIDRRGALCTVGEMVGVLFEDSTGHEAYFKSLRRDLLDTLDAAGCAAVIAQQWGKLGVVPAQIDCDYFDYLTGRGMALYQGEYMSQYSWAEYTNSTLRLQAIKL